MKTTACTRTSAHILVGSIAESAAVEGGSSRARARLRNFKRALAGADRGCATSACLALGLILAIGNPGSAEATSLTYDFGVQGSGTTIVGVPGGENTGITWFSPGFLAAGSILQSVTINVRLDDNPAPSETWASDLNFYVGGLLRIGSDSGWAASVGSADWANGQDSAIGATAIDTKTAGTDWSGDIDLNLATVYLRNAWATATWSGSMTLTYGAAAPTLTWTGADGTSPTQWSTSASVLNWTGGTAYTDGSAVIFDDSVGAGSRTVDISVADVAPASVTFNNTGANTYTLTGTKAITGATKLTKNGNGVLIVSNVNTYNGKTTISAGTLQLGVADALPHGAGKGNVVVDGTLDLNGLSPTLNAVTGTGTVTSSTAGSATLTIGDADTSSTFAGVLQDGSGTVGLTKIGTGTLTLSTMTNTYTGKTIIQAGTLKIGNVNNSDSIQLTNVGVAGPLGMPTGANATIDLWNGVTLLMGSTNPRVNQSTDRTINLADTGPGTVTIKVNDNDTNFTFGAVTATGTGAKLLDLYTGYQGNGDREKMTFNGPISENPGGGPLSLQVTYKTSSGSTSVVNLKEGGTFTGPITLVNGNGVNFAYLTIGGVLTPIFFSNDVTNDFSGSGTLNSGNYAGAISLDTNTILYYNSTAAQTLSGVISGAGSLTKDVAGSTLTLTGNNTYSGATTVKAGVLNIRHNTALGTIAAGTTVASGAALQLQGGITVGSEALALSGTGIAATGALRSISGANIYRGPVTLGGATRINSDADSLTFEVNGITGTNTSLTIGGAGDTTITAPVNLGAASGALTKDGAGLLNIDSGAQTYKTLTTTVGAGTTNVNVALTATGGTNVVANGKLRFGSVSQTLNSLTIGAGSTVTFTSGLASGAFSGGGGKTARLGAATVPEPGTLGLLLVGALGVLARRRRD